MRSILSNILKRKKNRRRTFADYQQELLIKQGRDQFKKLVERGLQVPIALL